VRVGDWLCGPIDQFCAREGWLHRVPVAAPNGGSARGYQAIFVLLTPLSCPGDGPMDGKPTVYFSLSLKAVWGADQRTWERE
jgi:hypothetical protein